MDKRLKQVDVYLGSNLVRRYGLTYWTGTNGTIVNARGVRVSSLLKQVTPYGADGTSALPPTTFTYWDLYNDITSQTATLTETIMTGDPNVALGSYVDLADMDGDGLPDVVQGLLNQWSYWRNLGNGSFAATPVNMTGDTSIPALSGANKAVLADMNGDGRADALEPRAGGWSYWPNLGNGSFGARVDITGDETLPDLNTDPYTRLIDMNGDGLPDVVRGYGDGVNPAVYSYWPNLGNGSFGPRVDMTNAPNLFLGSFNTRLADMNGDGLPDIVTMPTTNYSTDHLIYYPNKGTSFGAAVEMQRDPHAAYSNEWRLVDMNGDGTADVVLGQNPTGSTGNWGWWANNGQGMFETANPPDYNSAGLSNDDLVPSMASSAVRMADMNGDGLVDIVYGVSGDYRYWSIPAIYDYSSYGNGRYVGGGRLLMQVFGPMGHATEIKYASSRDFDNTGGDSIPDLSHPRWVVSQVRTYPGAWYGAVNECVPGEGLHCWTTTYTYSGGKYVGYPDFEFRGFRTVTATEYSDVGSPTTTTTFNQTDQLKGRVRVHSLQRQFRDHLRPE